MKNVVVLNAEEIKMVLASFKCWERTSKCDEPHWTYSPEYLALKKSLNEAVKSE